MTINRMNLRQIEAFRAVMLSGSMTEAAHRMHTSQPQVSRLIAQLEAVTRFALFDRSGSRLTPTQDGSRLFHEVEKTFIGLSGLEAAAANIRSFSAGRLSVAAMPRLAGGLLARIVVRFKTEYPDVMVSIQSGSASSVHDWVSSGFCDTGLAMLYSETPGVQVEPIINANCVAVLPRGHRLTKLKKLKAKDFAGMPFISFPTGSALRERIDGIFSAAHVERIISAEASLGASICAMVGAGLGLGLINPVAAEEERVKAGIEIRPFSPEVPAVIGLLYPPYHTRSRLASVFAQCAREVVREEMGMFDRHYK